MWSFYKLSNSEYPYPSCGRLRFISSSRKFNYRPFNVSIKIDAQAVIKQYNVNGHCPRYISVFWMLLHIFSVLKELFVFNQMRQITVNNLYRVFYLLIVIVASLDYLKSKWVWYWLNLIRHTDKWLLQGKQRKKQYIEK